MREVLVRRQKDLVLFMDRVKNEHNFSALIRTAEAVGIFQVFYGYEEDRPAPINEAVTLGAHRWVCLEKVESPVEKLQEFRDQGFQVVVTWLGAGTLDFREVDYTHPTIIVVGNEVEGVSPDLLPLATHRIKIPMMGMVRSLNVSVATGIILYEAFRQRETAGLYDRPQLTEKEMEEILRKWAYEDVIRSRRR
ncbi:tRNA (guanosine(18)-2'-O)-methyltransferase [Thermosulfurimonas dismutans]|uniref:tRNA (guanosine(18)-2'-O)-methyltransferase n=2 Tax=Thermosulfurimonas dismutans TaxID=999894 RepID=A0A179D3S0_9BACT|nr:tRNA (guanosine(18)-2'-O)-methyltransferase [Thermosulfurimonas dismutans]